MKSLCIKYLPLVMGIMLFISCNGNKGTADTTDNNPIYNSDPRIKAVTDQIKQEPGNAELYARRAYMMKQLKQDTLALKDYIKATTIDSNRAEYYSAVGELLFEHKDIEGSVSWFKKAIARDPTDPKAHLKMAKLFIYTKDYPKVFEQINIVLRRDVYNPEAYFLKGIAYKNMKDTAHAISTFETTVQVAPDYRDAIVQLGLLYSDKKDPLAIRYFDNAYRLDTNDVFPVFARGVYYQNNNDVVKAKEEYRRCIIKNHRFADAYFNMGYLLMQEDSIEKAFRQYDLATKVQPDNPTAYYDRGVCNEKLNKKADAILDYRRAIALDTSYASPKQALKVLGAK